MNDPKTSNDADAPKSSFEVAQAMEILKNAMRDDPDYAYGWHCNIAMACYDSISGLDHFDAHRAGNEAATRFMKMAFDVETEHRTT